MARFLLANIHGPNQDKPVFYEQIFKSLEDEGIVYWIIVGDWNLVMDQNLDTWNYKSTNNPSSIKIVKQNMERFNLLDIWREFNPLIKISHGLD